MGDTSKAGKQIGERLGDYELVALLAVGGTAEIYLARMGGEAGFEKYVVVKQLLSHLADDQDFVRMFLDEARISAQLEHSNIVQTLALGEHNGRYYLVLEFLGGLSLAQVARKAQTYLDGRLLPPELVLFTAASTCAGLHYAHNARGQDGKPLQLVHRDVSPQNLVLTFDGILKIVDFGIAKAEDRETHTRMGTIKGKFAYMSPEQAQAKPLDHRTDIFALGTICHELLTGRRLFKRGSTYQTYKAIISGEVPLLTDINPNLDPALNDLVLPALRPKPEDRYPNAEAFGEAIQSYLHKNGVAIGSGWVASFFDEHFQSDIAAHEQRMRLLIAGQETGIHELWGEKDEDGGAPEPEHTAPTKLNKSKVSSATKQRDEKPDPFEDIAKSIEEDAATETVSAPVPDGALDPDVLETDQVFGVPDPQFTTAPPGPKRSRGPLVACVVAGVSALAWWLFRSV